MSRAASSRPTVRGCIAAAVLACLASAAAAEFVVAPAEGPPLPVVHAAPPKATKLLPAPGKDVPLDDPAWREHTVSKAAYDAWREAVREADHAAKLAGYLGKICGREPEKVKAGDKLPEAAIVVGAACPEDIRAAAAKLGPDGWLIRTVGKRLFICGGGRQGTLYGIYAFLEDVLGCRWWARDAEFVPSMDQIATGPLDIAVTPPFLMHDLFNQEAQHAASDMLWKARSKATFQPTGNHNMYQLLSPAAATKPDYWPFVETKDKKTGEVTFRGRAVAKDLGDFNGRVLHFNYLASGMAEDLAAALGCEILRRGGNVADWVYMFGQGDWYGGLDQSPESQAVYEEESWTDADGHVHKGSSGPLLRLMNQTAGLVAKAHPGAQVGTLAYMSTDSPPGKTRPADNVWIWLPRLRYGITLSIEEAAAADRALANADPEAAERVPTTEAEQEAAEARAAGARTPTPAEELAAQRERERAARRREAAIKSAERSRKIKRSIERWAEIAPGRFLIWDYGVNYTNYLQPTPNLRAIAENIRWYHRLGVRGVMIQGNYTSTGGDLAVLKNYVWRKLLWNPALETEPLVREFCAGYYGPAADDILAYVTALEDSVRGPEPVIADEFDTLARYLTPELIATLEGALTRARQKVGGPGQEIFLQRVDEVAAGLEARTLWKPGQLVEQDGRLVRADLGNADTAARAETLARAARGSGVTEMSCAVTQTRRMLASNGGPLHALHAGAVTAKVAPRPGTARLWQVVHDGRVVMEKSSIAPGSDLFDVVGEPAADRIELVGLTGYGSWDGSPDHLQRETLRVEPDGTLRWTATLERTSKSEGAAAAVRIETSYAATKPEDVKAEYESESGWKPLEVATFTRKGRPLRADELKGQPPEPFIVEFAPRPGFRLRVTRAGSPDAVVDTIVSPRALAACAVWVPREKVVKTYVWCEPQAGLEVGTTVPLCERTIAIESQ
jgi:hypothetical protein